MKRNRRTATRMGLAAIAASSALVLGACGGGGNAPAGHQGAPAPGAAPNSGGSAAIASSCVPSSQILNNTQSYAGKQVTVTGTIVQVLGPQAVAIAATGQ